MKFFYALIYFIFPLISLDALALTNQVVSGNYSGFQNWEADTVKITGDVIIDGKLVINPGVYVEFQGHFELWADSIVAVGMLNDSITISINDTSGLSNVNIPDGGWKRIAARSLIEFDFCRIRYGKSADSDVPFPDLGSGLLVIFEQSTVPVVIINSVFSDNYCSQNIFSIVDASNTFEIRNSSFINNRFSSFRSFSTGISIIEKCNFFGNSGEMNNINISESRFERNNNLSLSVNSEGTLNLDHCIIRSNEYLSIIPGSAYSHFKLKNTLITNNTNLTLSCYGIAGLEISGNVISGNTFKSGILILECLFGSDKLLLVNNTICDNRVISGNDPFIVLSNNYPIEFYNNILSKNYSPQGIQISFKDYFSDQVFPLSGNFRYNLIEGGESAFEYDGIDGSLENNLDSDPLFVMPENFDFHLKETSPCVNSGATEIEGYSFPLIDLEGNARVLDFKVDIGAYEFNPGHTEILDQPESGNYCQGDEISVIINAYGGVSGYQWQRNGADIPGASNDTLLISYADTSVSGFYSCRITTADMNLYSDTVEINVYPIPAVFLGNDTTISTNDEIVLDAGEGFSEYLWNTGASDHLLPVTHADPGLFTYFVEVNDNHGCTSEDTIMVNVELADEISSFHRNGELKCYPNPATDFVYLESPVEMKNVTVSIVNSEGLTVSAKSFENFGKDQVHPFDLSGLENGIYFIVLDNFMYRIIKISH
jgi:hypothetical protein